LTERPEANITAQSEYTRSGDQFALSILVESSLPADSGRRMFKQRDTFHTTANTSTRDCRPITGQVSSATSRN
jgi:hypothetical protein